MSLYGVNPRCMRSEINAEQEVSPVSTTKYTQEQVIRALQEAHGLATIAAQILGCDATVVGGYIGGYPDVRRAYEAAREAIIDRAEEKLNDAVERGEQWAIIL